jgi:hypothetical protein
MPFKRSLYGLIPVFSLLHFTTVAAQQFPLYINYANGRITAGLNNADSNHRFTLAAVLPVTKPGKDAVIISADENKIITRHQISYFTNECEIINTVTRTAYGLQWDIAITGGEKEWSVPIETALTWEKNEDMQFWTTWAGPDINETDPFKWQHPFEPAPFRDLDLVYGGKNHLALQTFVIPVASAIFRKTNTAVSFSQSLSDTITDLHMRTSAAGTVSYIQHNRRISNKKTIHIRHRLVVHQADWRAAMKWMVDNNRPYFFPESPMANELAGCGAYSAWEGELDTAKYKKMGLGFNWKASFDFPYMGMFIPPVGSDTVQWQKFSFDGKGPLTSIQNLRNYSARFRKMGFHTLSYFNVTEFGNHISYPYRNDTATKDSIWKNANDFVYRNLRSGMLRPAELLPEWDDRPIYSNWEDCIAMDPGDSVYQAFLLQQAQLHIQKIPASSGICIDRPDWLRHYNSAGDDGISMVNDNKVRSLLFSWKAIMEKIGPMMHANNKVIFCNPLYRRIDLMQHIDGFYDEYGQYPACLNLTTQLGMFKPVVAWTVNAADFLPNPDACFQRHLYMGAFLTVPFPGNDHTINPDPVIEKYYLDYGPLLSAIKGREWVLVPDIISVQENLAKANIFRVKEKFIIPVIHGGDNEFVKLVLQIPASLQNKSQLTVKTLYPGEEKWSLAGRKNYEARMVITVKLKRGCALVSLE